MQTRFTKIKYNKGMVKLHYDSISSMGNAESYVVSSEDLPLQSFNEAFQAVGEFVAEICEIATESPIEVLGVSFGYGGDAEVMGATITAKLELENSNSPLIMNTPYKPSEPYTEGGDESVLLPVRCVKALDVLSKEAKKYLNGERAQGELFAGESNPGVKVS